MNKKEITTLIVTGVLVFLVATFGCYSLAKAPSDDSNDTPNSSANSKDSVKAGNYTYIGIGCGKMEAFPEKKPAGA